MATGLLSRASLPVAIVAALAAGWFTFARAYTSFEPARLRLVSSPTPVGDGTFTLHGPLADDEGALAPPFAVIVRAGGSARPQTIRISLDGQRLCDVRIDTGPARRFDCVMQGPWTPSTDHTLTIAGTAAWSLDYLEVATHHGRARDVLDLFIVPPGSTAYTRSAWPAVVVGVCVGLLLLIQPAAMPRRMRHVHAALVVLIGVIAILVAISAWVSNYLLIVATRTVVLGAAIALAPRIWTVAAVLVPAFARWLTPSRRRLGACLLTGLVIGAAFHGVVRARLAPFDGNYSALLVIERGRFERSPLVAHRQDLRDTLVLDESGYDGQFMYYMALDPLLRQFKDDPQQYGLVVDAPAYRYGRIGFSWMAAIAALGRWQYLPGTMAWLVIVGLALAGVVLARLAQAHGRPAALGLLVLLVPGFWQSIQVGLPEPIAAALIIAGCFAFTRQRYATAAVALALSLLVRETGAIIVICLAAALWRQGGARRAIAWLAATAAPVVCWRLYVGSVLYPALGAAAFFQNPRNLGMPYEGVWTMVSASWGGTYFDGHTDMVRAALWFPVALTVGLAAALRLFWSRRDALSVAACLYGLMAVSLDYAAVWVHVGNGQRGSYELFVAMALLTATSARTQSRTDRLVTWAFWVVTASYVFYGAFDAGNLVRAMAMAVG